MRGELINPDVSEMTTPGLLENITTVKSDKIIAPVNLTNTFGLCRALTDISGLANWDTGSTTNMSGMFADCLSLTSVDALANWNTEKVTSMKSMFAMMTGTSGLTDVSVLSNWDVTGTNIDEMFFSIPTNITKYPSWWPYQ